MIDAKRLLDDLKRLLRRLEDDLRERSQTDDALHDTLQREYQAARDAGRTGDAFEAWREGMLTQAAVAWLLGCVFVRFMEDNGLVDESLLSGSQVRRQQASDRQMRYFRQRPTDTDRDYLYDVFRTVAQLPAVATLFDAQHHPVWVYGISGDAAKELIGFWRQVVPETGELLHDFTDPTWNTRFLGDLYQDLSEDARKRYALLQTPEFVESFILDRTLEPAIETFGLQDVRLIDPTCGSGHFFAGCLPEAAGSVVSPRARHGGARAGAARPGCGGGRRRQSLRRGHCPLSPAAGGVAGERHRQVARGAGVSHQCHGRG